MLKKDAFAVRGATLFVPVHERAAMGRVGASFTPTHAKLVAAWLKEAGRTSGDTTVISHVMRLVESGVKMTGRTLISRRVAAAQLAEPIARRLLALGQASSVDAKGYAPAQPVAAALLLADQTQAQNIVARLEFKGFLSAEQAQNMRRAIVLAPSAADPVASILPLLPFRIAQAILKSREEFLQAFFASWAESLAKNAELDKAAAARAQKQNAEVQRVNKQNAVAQGNLARAVQKSQKDKRQLLAAIHRQAESIFRNAHSLAISEGLIASLGSTMPAVDADAAFVRGTEGRLLIEPAFNCSVAAALDEPTHAIGPVVGHRMRPNPGTQAI